MASVNLQKVRDFWHRFFNEGQATAFDDIADKAYHENGKPSDGGYLKKWVEGLRAKANINVAITREVEDGDLIAIHWIANPVAKATGARLDPIQGINVLQFKDGRIINNWHCQER